MSTSDASRNSIPEENYYPFGQKSVAMLGLLLTSDGKVKVLAYRRPSTDPTQPFKKMEKLYESAELTLKTGTISFTLALASDNDKEGLLTVEPLGWSRAYEVNRTHFLGRLNPFDTDELPYRELGSASERSGDFEANRVFAGVYRYDPTADAKKKAVLTLTDVDSEGQSEETISISSFDDTGLVGRIFVAIRVNAAHLADACASVEFTGGHTVDVTHSGGTQLSKLSKLVLNKSNNSPLPPAK